VAPRAAAEFAGLAGDPAQALGVAYVPSAPVAERAVAAPEEIEPAFAARLLERRSDELVRRTTLVGPHRDDVALLVHDIVARGFASHGEAWGAALSLRLALASAVADEVREPPITFLDDPFSPFDPDRRQRLAASLDGRGQVVISVPDDAQVPPGATVWRVKEGTVLPQ
jgi:DNA replication and repair protein RecF